MDRARGCMRGDNTVGMFEGCGGTTTTRTNRTAAILSSDSEFRKIGSHWIDSNGCLQEDFLDV